jgi:hypothetical protein
VYGDLDKPDVRRKICQDDVNILHTYFRLGFGLLIVFMSILVSAGACLGGVNRFCVPSYSGRSTPDCKSFSQWIIAVCCSFNKGYNFVANIGSGMGITMFFVLSMFLGVETKRALPTSIVISGWTAIVPAAVHSYYMEHIPYLRLLMLSGL